MASRSPPPRPGYGAGNAVAAGPPGRQCSGPQARIEVRVSPVCSPRVPLGRAIYVPGGPSPVDTQSTQSAPSAPTFPSLRSGSSGIITPVPSGDPSRPPRGLHFATPTVGPPPPGPPAPPGRAESAGAAPGLPGQGTAPVLVPTVLPSAVTSAPTLSTVSTVPSPAAWTTVLPQAQEWDPHILREKLERIQQEVKNVALMQKHSEELENTRQRVNEMVGTLQFQQVQMHETSLKREELRSQLAEKDRQLQEAEQRLQELTGEHEQTKRSLAKATNDINSMLASKERMEDERRSSMDRDEANRARVEELQRRCRELEQAEQELTEQVRTLSSNHQRLEAEASEATRRCSEISGRLHAADEAARRLEGEKRLLEVEVEKVQSKADEAVEETRGFRSRVAMLEEELRSAREQCDRSEQEQGRAEQDLRQWYQKFIESSKDGTSLQKTAQEQRKLIWDLEGQLRRERTASVPTPGQLLKSMRAHEGSSVAAENSRLKKAVARAQCDLQLCMKKLDEQEKVIRQLQAL